MHVTAALYRALKATPKFYEETVPIALADIICPSEFNWIYHKLVSTLFIIAMCANLWVSTIFALKKFVLVKSYQWVILHDEL